MKLYDNYAEKSNLNRSFLKFEEQKFEMGEQRSESGRQNKGEVRLGKQVDAEIVTLNFELPQIGEN
jgi:hypothetical protein